MPSGVVYEAVAVVAPTLKIFTFLPVASIPAATNRPLALTATAWGELASGYDRVRVGVAETVYSVTRRTAGWRWR